MPIVSADDRAETCEVYMETKNIVGFVNDIPVEFLVASNGAIDKVGLALKEAGLLGFFGPCNVTCEQAEVIPDYGSKIIRGAENTVGPRWADWANCNWEKFLAQAQLDIKKYRDRINNFSICRDETIQVRGRTAGYYLMACPGYNRGKDLFVPDRPEELPDHLFAATAHIITEQDQGAIHPHGWRRGKNYGQINSDFTVVVDVNDMELIEDERVTKDVSCPLPHSNMKATETTWRPTPCVATIRVTVWGSPHKRVRLQRWAKIEVSEVDSLLAVIAAYESASTFKREFRNEDYSSVFGQNRLLDHGSRERLVRNALRQR